MAGHASRASSAMNQAALVQISEVCRGPGAGPATGALPLTCDFRAFKKKLAMLIYCRTAVEREWWGATSPAVESPCNVDSV
jgi:hypothetical protein